MGLILTPDQPASTASIAQLQSQIDTYTARIAQEQDGLKQMTDKVNKFQQILNSAGPDIGQTIIDGHTLFPAKLYDVKGSVTNEEIKLYSDPKFNYNDPVYKYRLAISAYYSYQRLIEYLNGIHDIPGYNSNGIGHVNHDVSKFVAGETVNSFAIYANDQYGGHIQPFAFGSRNDQGKEETITSYPSTIDSVVNKSLFDWQGGWSGVPDIYNPVLQTITDSYGTTLTIPDRKILIDNLIQSQTNYQTALTNALNTITKENVINQMQTETTSLDAVTNKSNTLAIIAVIGILIGIFVAYKFLF